MTGDAAHESRPARSRFREIPARAARLVLTLTALLIVYGLLAPAASLRSRNPAADPSKGDAALYRAVVHRMRSGDSYYVAAAAEHRVRGYPLFPFVTVRPPALAMLTAPLGSDDYAVRLFRIIALLTAIAITWTIQRRTGSPALTVLGGSLTMAALYAASYFAAFHEAWASMLIVLSLALQSRRAWLASVACGLAALLMRELSVAFVLVMFAFAANERRLREAGAWLLSLAIGACALFYHAAQVAAVRVPADLHSPGWVGLGGWPFVLRSLHEITILIFLPLWCCAVIVPLCIVGIAGCDDPIASRATLYSTGFMLALMIVGRPDNYYWGLMIGPVVLLGLLFSPLALRDLVVRATSVASSAPVADRL